MSTTVSIRDIAKVVGISDAAVSMALRGHPRISLERRRQVADVSKRLGYRANVSARAMRTHKSHSIGLLMPNFRTGISNLKAEAIEQSMVQRGYHVLMGFTRAECGRTAEYVQDMAARQVDGLIISWGVEAEWPALKDVLRRVDIPCVLVDFAFDTGFPEVRVDLAVGMRMMAGHLLAFGHRDVAFVCSTRRIGGAKWEGLVKGLAGSSVRLRWTSSRWPGTYAVDQPGDDIPEEGMVPNSYDPAEEERLAYAKALEIAAWAERPTAVVLPSDNRAMAFVDGLMSAGVRVPEDISVAGFDDADEARFFRPRLTTVRQPREELGRKAAELLLSLMGEKPSGKAERVELVPELVVRDSTAPVGVVDRQEVEAMNTTNQGGAR